MIVFIVGFIVGAFMGIGMISLCISASRADAIIEQAEDQRWYESQRP